MASTAGALAVLLWVSCQANMLSNAGFESWRGGMPEGWSRYGGSELTVLSQSRDAHSGQFAVELVDKSPEEREGRWSIGLYQTVPAKPGRIYVARCWAKCLSANHRTAALLQITFLPNFKSFSTSLTQHADGKWRLVTVAAEAPAWAKEVRLYIYTIHYWQCRVIVDDAELSELTREEFGPRYLTLAYGCSGIARPRPLDLSVPIASAGRARAVIWAPRGADGRRLAHHLRDGLRQICGAELDVIDDCRGVPKKLAGKTVIALGNLNNNFLIERLYWNYYVRIDSAHPGAGEYQICTVFEPYSLPEGMKVLVVGASDTAGLRRAVRRFLEMARRAAQGGELAFQGPINEVSGVKPIDSEREKAIVEAPLRRMQWWVDFCRAAEAWRDTGQIAWAKRARYVMLRLIERAEQNPLYRVEWPEETNSWRIGPAWDVVEEAPVWTDQERLRALNVLLNCCLGLRRHVSGYGSWSAGDRITWNHTTFPLLGIYFLARYFLQHYGDIDGFLEPMMAEVRGCFEGQKRSWKPQEDADGYMLLSPTHTIRYTLAEGDYSYFESGMVRRWAEYVTGWCDNSGRNGGFGDSGYGRVAVYERNALPWALWYYRDGRYLWRMLRLHPDWKNPYDPTVRPKPWRELVGVTVFELHPEVYRYTQRWPYYGEPLTPPNVPLEKCFDKIVFRGGLDVDDEYLLLDGFATGKHLHYDGNAICKYTRFNCDWLIDHDYLVRNTTEHCMVTPQFEGVCSQREPVCAALEALAEWDDLAAVHTAVYDWCNIDWHRYLVWLKGQGVVCLDRCVARKDGRYKLEAVWKMLDRGEADMSGGRLDVQWLMGELPGTRNVSIVEGPPPAQRSVMFTSRNSRLEFVVDLPPGRYRMVLIARGTNTGADSFWVQIDGGPRVAFHVPVGKFGPSSASFTKGEPSPTVEVAKAGRHRVTITMRESPPQWIDRIEFRRADTGELVKALEAEEAPPLPPETIRRELAKLERRRFHLITNGLGRLRISRRINTVRLKLRYLHQRLQAQMSAGDERVFHTVFWAQRAEESGLELAAWGPNWARVQSPTGPIFVQFRTKSARGPISTDADVAVCGRDWLALIGCTRVAGQALGDEQATVRVDLRTGRFVAPEKSRPAARGGKLSRAALQRLRREIAGALSARTDAPASWRGQAAAQMDLSAARKARRLWAVERQTVEGEGPVPIADALVGDVDGDGAEELVIARGYQIECYGPDGARKWMATADGEVSCLGLVPLRQGPRLLAGGWDEKLYVLGPDGQIERKLQMKREWYKGLSSVTRPVPDLIASADLNGDGAPEIVVPMKTGVVVCFDDRLRALWDSRPIEHGVRQLDFVDLDGDGKLELACSNRYGAVKVLDWRGNLIGYVYSELGDVAAAVGKLPGIEGPAIANGSSTGVLALWRWQGQRKLWQFANHGYGWTCVRIADADGDGAPEIVASSAGGAVFAFAPDGKVKWRVDLPDAAEELVVLGGGRLIVACADGRWYELAGRRVARWGELARDEAVKRIIVRRGRLLAVGEFSAACFRR